jgi:hypothetical protein
MIALEPVGDVRESRADRQLDACDLLLAEHLQAAMQRFGAAALGVIDLPPIATGEIVAAQVSATAVLFWTMEIERAGLPSFVEALADQLVHGRLLLPLTSGGDRLMQYWRARHERLDADERAAIWHRIFGAEGDAAAPFPVLFARVIESLANLGRAAPTDSHEYLATRAAANARDLAEYLSTEGAGMAAFAARDIVENIRTSLALLRDPDIAGALGVGGPWQIIRAHSAWLLAREVDPTLHLDRAASGMTILQWLAEHAAGLDLARASIDPASPVVHAALSWQAAQGSP